jgi:hypothetical protein
MKRIVIVLLVGIATAQAETNVYFIDGNKLLKACGSADEEAAK